MASSSDDKSICLFERSDNDEFVVKEKNTNMNSQIAYVSFSKDSSVLCSGGCDDYKMRMWAVPNINELLFEMQLEKEFHINCFDISAKEQVIAVGG